jgi:hypothetical protein
MTSLPKVWKSYRPRNTWATYVLITIQCWFFQNGFTIRKTLWAVSVESWDSSHPHEFFFLILLFFFFFQTKSVKKNQLTFHISKNKADFGMTIALFIKPPSADHSKRCQQKHSRKVWLVRVVWIFDDSKLTTFFSWWTCFVFLFFLWSNSQIVCFAVVFLVKTVFFFFSLAFWR